MIVDIEQLKTNFDMSWIAKTGSSVISRAEAPFIKGKFQVKIAVSAEEQLDLYYNPMDTTWGTKLSDRLSFKLFKGTELIGKIVGKTKKIGLMKSYAYYEFLIGNDYYYGYEVGFGKAGLYFCIYHENNLIAIVEKMLRVVNYQDHYRVYMVSSDDLKIVFPFVVYYDVTSYGDIMEVAVKSVKVKYVKTIQKALIEKYNPDFIAKIKRMDGIKE